MVKYLGHIDQLVGIRLPADVAPSTFDRAYDRCSEHFRRVEIVEDDGSVLLRSELAWDAQQEHLTAEPA